MLEEIKNDLDLIRFDGVTEIAVYTGGLAELEKTNLSWHKETGFESQILGLEYIETLRLSEIVEQLKDAPLITIIKNDPRVTEIWQYGNYGDRWFKLDEICGYA